MKKDYFVYYGTEENAYEIEKSGAFTKEEAIDFAKKNYLDEYMEEDEIPDTISELENGHGVEFEDKWKGYGMYVGIAKKGNVKPIRSTLSDLRRMIVGYF